MEWVSTTWRQWRWAATAPQMSIHSITLPPNAVFTELASEGRIICVITTSDSRGLLGGNSGTADSLSGEEGRDAVEEFLAPPAGADVLGGHVEHQAVHAILGLQHLGEAGVIPIEAAKEVLLHALFLLAAPLEDASEQHVHMGHVEADDPVRLHDAAREALEVLEVQIQLRVRHVPQAMQVLGEDLRILVQRAVLHAALLHRVDELVVLDPPDEELELEGEGPPPHVRVVVLEEAVVDDGLVEELEAEGLADELGGGRLARADVAGQGHEAPGAGRPHAAHRVACLGLGERRGGGRRGREGGISRGLRGALAGGGAGHTGQGLNAGWGARPRPGAAGPAGPS